MIIQRKVNLFVFIQYFCKLNQKIKKKKKKQKKMVCFKFTYLSSLLVKKKEKNLREKIKY